MCCVLTAAFFRLFCDFEQVWSTQWCVCVCVRACAHVCVCVCVILLFLSNPITFLDGLLRFQEVEAPIFQDNWHMKVVRSALRSGRLSPQELFLVLIVVAQW
jgi:hypothetical protein